ncbi:TldD/PmbA family protein [Clostridium oryzae]|uniref:TldD/PmbA family protein n=1 Tax=Clostridium oryzae TaxID=1450648 RepID=UPI0014758E86|nr:TldD/PmbA family protein [Clostridium oryzae]
MVKVKMSRFLQMKKAALKQLIKELEKEFSYVSVLGTDSFGKIYRVDKNAVSIADSLWNERGFVVRIHNGLGYSEYSFNDINDNDILQIAKDIKIRVNNQLETLKGNVNITEYPVIEEKAIERDFRGEIGINPETTSDGDIIGKLSGIKDKIFSSSELLINGRVIFHEVHISKIFLSGKKDLSQSYVWSEGYCVAIVRKDDNVKVGFKAASGLKGVELIDEIEKNAKSTVDTAVKLLSARSIEPGEYDVICTPEVVGMIAHEAFGHGVEMDMFVKHRAKAAEYIGKQVASELVTMRDGAASAKHVSSYMFDDEGVIAQDTVIIENGILKNGLSDTLSALKLGTKPTGNGKRFSFERKTYARMTNTFIEAGKDKIEDMIASVKHGYLLASPSSGMEDPKNWGIQCMVDYGIEIVDGKLTDNIVSPVVLTGYVPDVLKTISMLSEKVELGGSGMCGKGYKEFAKVSDGGPYIKAKVRLG